jgi:lauroyl/myristoyl acyltransferase
MLLPVRLIRHFVRRQVILTGLETLEAALDGGGGAIVFTCHMGPYYALPIALALSGHRVVIVERLGFVGSPLISYQVKRLNSLLGGRFITLTTAYDSQLLRKLEQHLRQGEVLFLMGDYRGASNRKEEYSKFLGYDIVPGRGIAWLHYRTQAPMIPVRYVGSQRAVAKFEIRDKLQVDYGISVADITQRVYGVLEDQVLERPECWALWIDYHLMLAPHVFQEAHTAECANS